jgi:hypothetical protein
MIKATMKEMLGEYYDENLVENMESEGMGGKRST